jgi:hypothetical protein
MEGALAANDFKSMLADMKLAHIAAGETMFYLAITPEGTPALSSDARAEASRMLPEVFAISNSIHNVLEGTGFWASIMRSMFAGLLLTSGQRGKVLVHDTVRAAAEHIAPHVHKTPDELLREIEATGITTRANAARAV